MQYSSHKHNKMKSLKDLAESGAGVTDSFSSSDQLPQMPDEFDHARFKRGRQFFKDNIFSCTIAMLLSLISGLSVSNLLEPLVFTEQSNTPGKSLRRYLRTFHHVVLWHFGDVWDTTSDAHKSVAEVRRMHRSVGSRMAEQQDVKEWGTHQIFVSQYDMSLVQCGFMGAIVMYPHSFGIRCSKKDLSDYTYFWYGLAYLLGISDQNNICNMGVDETRSICHEIEDNVLLPALQDPPGEFYPMAKALTDGMNTVCHCQVFSVESSLAVVLSIMSAQHPKLSFADQARMLLLRGLLFIVQYVPFCRYLMNKLFLAGLKDMMKNIVNISIDRYY